MNIKWNKFEGILLGVLCLAGCSSPSIHVQITNQTDIAWNNEITEIPISAFEGKLSTVADKQFIITDEQNNEVPYQVTYDDLVIFPVTVAANGNVRYTIKQGRPAPVNTIACGKIYPERMDDVAWENDKAAFRAYGPALQKNGERAFGYDVFTKRGTKEPVVEARYTLELSKEHWEQIQALRKAGEKDKADSLATAISYHVDHGNGMDDYSVGATLGGGTAALMNDTAIVYPWAYKTCEIIDNGPLRFTMKLTYNPLTVANDSSVIETRLISFDAGSYLNKTQVSFENLNEETPIATGLVIHPQNPKGYDYSANDSYIAYADLTDHPDRDQGIIFVGATFAEPLINARVQLFNEAEKDLHKGALGHVLGISNYQPNSIFTYYWGSGWSKGDMPSMDDWTSYLKAYETKVRNPLIIEITK